MQPCVYILANKKHGTIYIGVTSHLVKRVWQHKNHMVDGFTKKYNVSQLVYFEMHSTMLDAITREKKLKNWKRQWKIDFLEASNPAWDDLWESINH